MNKGFNIKIVHENMGTLLNETFSSGDQFKLFLRLVDGCMAHKSDFDFFMVRALANTTDDCYIELYNILLR